MRVKSALERAWRETRSLASGLRAAPGRENARYEVARLLAGEPALPAAVERVVVICQGNICRSPFAAALLARALPELEIRSAGLAASGGDPAEPGAIRVATEHGLDLRGHRSTRMDAALADWAQLILGMEGHHVYGVARRWPEAQGKTRIVGDFAARVPRLIPDPWGLPDEVFRDTFGRIAAAVDGLAGRLRREGGTW